MKKSIAMILCLLLAVSMLAGCGTEKYDVSVPYSFQESEPVQNVTSVTAAQEAPAEPEPEAPAEIPEDAPAEVPADTAEAVLPLSDAEMAEEPAEASSDIAGGSGACRRGSDAALCPERGGRCAALLQPCGRGRMAGCGRDTVLRCAGRRHGGTGSPVLRRADGRR